MSQVYPPQQWKQSRALRTLHRHESGYNEKLRLLMDGAASTSSSSSSSKVVEELLGGDEDGSASQVVPSVRVVAGERVRVRGKRAALRKPVTDVKGDRLRDRGGDKGKALKKASLPLYENIAPMTLISKWFILEGNKKSWFKGKYVHTHAPTESEF